MKEKKIIVLLLMCIAVFSVAPKKLIARADSVMVTNCQYRGMVLAIGNSTDGCQWLIQKENGDLLNFVTPISSIYLRDSLPVGFNYYYDSTLEQTCELAPTVFVDCIRELADTNVCSAEFGYYSADTLITIAPIDTLGAGYIYHFFPLHNYGYDSVNWFVNGNYVTNQLAPFLTLETGWNYVCLLVSGNNCVDEQCDSIYVHADTSSYCSANFSITKQRCAENKRCGKNTYQFTDISKGDVVYREWVIDYTDTILNTPSVGYQFDSSGYHFITLKIVTADSCSSELTREIFINSGSGCYAEMEYYPMDCVINPADSVGDSTSIDCGYYAYMFYDVSKGSTVSSIWEVNGDTVSTDSMFVYDFMQPGRYEVKLTTKWENGCMASNSEIIYIGDTSNYCKAYFAYYNNSCWNDSVECMQDPLAFTFVDKSVGDVIRRFWTINGDTIYNKATVKYQFPDFGIYRARLEIITASGCTSIFDTKIIVGDTTPICKAYFDACAYTISPNVHDSLHVNRNLLWGFKNMSTGNIKRIMWIFGDGTYSSQTDPLHKYKKPGVYNVCLKIETYNGCESKFCKLIYVGVNECAIDFEYTIAVPNCSDFEVYHLFKAVSEKPVKMNEWYVDGEYAGKTPILYHQFSHYGNHKVCLKAKLVNGCEAKVCKNIYVWQHDIDSLFINRCTSVNELKNSVEITKAYPNPASNQLNIVVNALNHQNLTLRIVNMLGSEVLVKENNEILAGENLINIDISQLKTGTYIYLLSGNNQVKRGKFTVIR